MTLLSICLDLLHRLRWKLSLSKVTSHPPGYAWKGTLCLCTFHCHKCYLSVKTPLARNCSVNNFYHLKARLGTSGFYCADRLLSHFCRPQLLPDMLSWAHSSQHSRGERLYSTGAEAAHWFVCVKWAQELTQPSPPLCATDPGREGVCVSNGIPGKRCLTAGLVTTEIAVLSIECLLALQIFNLVVKMLGWGWSWYCEEEKASRQFAQDNGCREQPLPGSCSPFQASTLNYNHV